ncbi:hypothetical protein QGN29_14320 [Temperatibacter marinus]|uniref:Replication-relaxation n=1 Tax=Temperatibacter marinus TaxID=1456591 RepID=A0AA52HAL4_9PROT|nr:hypothetical protein [Temperatibacter marinus]WND02723.1 hypothetical protein QGN29_14320 [Temperatibacter marinus]
MTISNNKKHEIYIMMVLCHLKVSGWSSQDLIQLLCGFNSRQMAHRLLSNMEKQGLIRRHQFSLDDGRRKTIWSLSPHGLGMALQPDEDLSAYKLFKPAKFHFGTYDHEVMLREVQIHCDTFGWADFHYENTMKIKGQKKPDALVTDKKGQIICIECERSTKSHIRYQQLTYQHILKLNKGVYHKVLYITPDDAFNRRLQQIMMGIESVKHNQRLINIRDEHRKPFTFITMTKFREYAENARADKQENSVRNAH